MILNIINEITADNGKIYKQEILTKHENNIQFKQVLMLAYNPNVNFYIKKLPEFAETLPTKGMPLAESIGILTDISERKYTGNDAKEKLASILTQSDSNNREVIRRIIGKSLECGISVNSINKAYGKIIPKTPYMGAVGFDEKKARKLFKDGNVCESDVKMDGRYVNIIVNNGTVDMVSRQAKNSIINNTKLLTNSKFMAGMLAGNIELEDGIVFNGELMLKGVERYEANGILSSLIKITEKESNGDDITKEIAKFKKRHSMTFQAAVDNVYVTMWDYLPYTNYIQDTVYDVPRKTRLETLEKVMPVLSNEIKLVEYKFVKTYEEAIAHFQECINRGEEGTILKSLNGTWENKKPVYQIKMKLEITVDLKIIGFNQGSKDSKFENTLGSLQCSSKNGKLLTDPSGYSDELRDTIWNNQDEIINWIVEVKCNSVSHDRDGNYSLMHPVFMSFRDDKDESDSLEQILENQNMVLGLTDAEIEAPENIKSGE